jgi:glycerol-3-phosphate acyltransferase PlsX
VTPSSTEPGRVVAVDVMGADKGPAEIIEGARRAAEELGVPVLLVGRPDAIGDPGDLDMLAAEEVIGMEEDPAGALRRKKDASVVRAAEAVKAGNAGAMVSAGNTGAAMASALLRMGRLSGVSRPAIATPIPVHGSTPTVLLDAGANAECQPAWLVQFAQMGAAFFSGHYGVEAPRVGLLSIGEEASKGSPQVT